MDIQTIALIVTLLVMAVGLVFSLIPPLPGSVLIWAAATFYGLYLGWEAHMGWATFGILTVLMTSGVVAEIIAGHVGTKIGGASWLAVTVGLILGVVFGIVASFIGTPLLGCVGGLLGTTVSVLVIEWWRNQNREIAIKSLKGFCVGSVVGNIAKFITSILMITIFLLKVFGYGF